MATGRQRDEWNRTSWLLAMLFNAHKPAEENVREPKDFNPFNRSAAAAPVDDRIMVDITALKMFLPPENPTVLKG